MKSRLNFLNVSLVVPCDTTKKDKVPPWLLDMDGGTSEGRGGGVHVIVYPFATEVSFDAMEREE